MFKTNVWKESSSPIFFEHLKNLVKGKMAISLDNQQGVGTVTYVICHIYSDITASKDWKYNMSLPVYYFFYLWHVTKAITGPVI